MSSRYRCNRAVKIKYIRIGQLHAVLFYQTCVTMPGERDMICKREANQSRGSFWQLVNLGSRLEVDLSENQFPVY